MTDERTRNRLFGRLSLATKGWLPGVGSVYAITLDEEEHAAMLEILGLRPEGRASEVRLNDDGTLDEVVCRGDQLEQMDYNHWFLQIGDVAVWLHAKGKITASYERRADVSPQGKCSMCGAATPCPIGAFDCPLASVSSPQPR